jgi:hypothetical protein
MIYKDFTLKSVPFGPEAPFYCLLLATVTRLVELALAQIAAGAGVVFCWLPTRGSNFVASKRRHFPCDQGILAH